MAGLIATVREDEGALMGVISSSGSSTLPRITASASCVCSRVDFSLVGRNLLYFFPKAFHDIDVDQYPGRTIFGGVSREYNLQTPTTRSFGFNVNVVF